MNEYDSGRHMDPRYDGWQSSEPPQLERVVTIGEWIRLWLVSLFSLIPFIGWIVALVIYIIKATDMTKPQSYRNLIKAGFIILGISIALGILFFIFFMALGLSLFSNFADFADFGVFETF